jgi:serine/threonine protein kinase/HAMP domain-containing protein
MKLVGRYQIQARIGQGAMANVYRAYDPSIDRVLAIKVLKREYCREPDSAKRFLREAKAAGALSHPNIVTIFDVGEIDGFPFIVMEMLDGAPLDQAIRSRGRFEVAEVLAIGEQLASALAYAHAQGVIHRDIKPSNIMLLKDGSIKLLDFGIARVSERSAAAEAEAVRTQIGQVLGTPRYMSPEQALGRELDGRSDLFSIGAILYELVTGQPAFNGSSAATLALQITQQKPAPISVTPECPPGLKFIIGKLLEKRPEKRFTDGAHLAQALDREYRTHRAVMQEGRKRRIPLQAKLTLAMSAAVAVVLIVSIGLVLDRQYRAMEQLAITSGASIAAFIANNAALSAVDNATRPEAERDWLPVQAFINTASGDPNVTQMMVIDNLGVIRAASDPALIGSPYMVPRGRQLARADAQISVTSVRASNGVESFRFAHPITYAGRPFGSVDISVRKSELNAAANLTAMLLIGLGVLTLLVVTALSLTASFLLVEPVRRLRAAFEDVAAGDLEFRISHQRQDEFGDLFNSFNAFVGAVQRRLDNPARLARAEATSILPANEIAASGGERAA